MTTLSSLLIVLCALCATMPEIAAILIISPLIAWEMWLDYLKARDAARAGTAKGRDDELA